MQQTLRLRLAEVSSGTHKLSCDYLPPAVVHWGHILWNFDIHPYTVGRCLLITCNKYLSYLHIVIIAVIFFYFRTSCFTHIHVYTLLSNNYILYNFRYWYHIDHSVVSSLRKLSSQRRWATGIKTRCCSQSRWSPQFRSMPGSGAQCSARFPTWGFPSMGV